eukprot:scaffold245742_cov45-Prasinocladus_malaysianus.AAC.1
MGRLVRPADVVRLCASDSMLLMGGSFILTNSPIICDAGATASFDKHGAVRQLPEYYVPAAYREWGVEVVDWTHMTSTRVTSDGLENNVKKFMPTVGCEADAVAFEEDIHNALKAAEGQGWEAKTITVKGSY